MKKEMQEEVPTLLLSTCGTDASKRLVIWCERCPVCRKSFGEGEGRVYESDEDPLDLHSPVEGKIEIKIR